MTGSCWLSPARDVPKSSIYSTHSCDVYRALCIHDVLDTSPTHHIPRARPPASHGLCESIYLAPYARSIQEDHAILYTRRAHLPILNATLITARGRCR